MRQRRKPSTRLPCGIELYRRTIADRMRPKRHGERKNDGDYHLVSAHLPGKQQITGKATRRSRNSRHLTSGRRTADVRAELIACGIVPRSEGKPVPQRDSGAVSDSAAVLEQRLRTGAGQDAEMNSAFLLTGRNLRNEPTGLRISSHSHSQTCLVGSENIAVKWLRLGLLGHECRLDCRHDPGIAGLCPDFLPRTG